MRRLAVPIAAFTVAACGAYTIIYLYRWEWHRALVAGVFLVVAEVALATMLLLRRVANLERRVDALAGEVAGGADGGPGKIEIVLPFLDATPAGSGAPRPEPVASGVLTRIRNTAPAPARRFAWLEPDRFGVFLPILLGAGVLASSVAWVVEALARATARPALERGLAARLAPLALPAGGLLGPPAPAPARVASRLAARGRLVRIGLPAAALAAAAFGVEELADATQTRPDSVRPGVATVVELELHGDLNGHPARRVVSALWSSCAGTLRRDLPEASITAAGGVRWRIVVGGDLGDHGAQRVHGCLEDALVDHVQAGVVEMRAIPSAGAAAVLSAG